MPALGLGVAGLVGLLAGTGQILLGLVQLAAQLAQLAVQLFILVLQLLATGGRQIAGGTQLVELAPQLVDLAGEALIVLAELVVGRLEGRLVAAEGRELFAEPRGLAARALELAPGGVEFTTNVFELTTQARILVGIVGSATLVGAQLFDLLQELGVADLQLVHEVVDRAGPVPVLVWLASHREADALDLIEGQGHLVTPHQQVHWQASHLARLNQDAAPLGTISTGSGYSTRAAGRDVGPSGDSPAHQKNAMTRFCNT